MRTTVFPRYIRNSAHELIYHRETLTGDTIDAVLDLRCDLIIPDGLSVRETTRERIFDEIGFWGL